MLSASQDFEKRVLPHLDAAYNLARWLLRDDFSAEDAVQEASIRAFRHLSSLRGADARPWLLGILRNTCFSMLERQRSRPDVVEFDEASFMAAATAAPGSDPAAIAQGHRLRQQVDAALRALSPPLREVIVLREFEELEYAQIAAIVGVPIGTVMSRLSRARERLRMALGGMMQGDVK
ncbi:MAG TPA: sigma-70 family RNA polymerase sigma factor [Burkholderiaceae bacterium]|nr:sigma-70 family RNA polymerase sigma factor [Burkholderiaceae bacterium]